MLHDALPMAQRVNAQRGQLGVGELQDLEPVQLSGVEEVKVLLQPHRSQPVAHVAQSPVLGVRLCLESVLWREREFPAPHTRM